MPQFYIDKASLSKGVNVIEVIGCCFSSKSECRKLIASGGVSINREKLTDHDRIISDNDLLSHRYLLVQKGKRNYFLLIAK